MHAVSLSASAVPPRLKPQLEDSVASDPTPTSAKSFGLRVGHWSGRMLAKAADWSWEISIATAGALLASTLAKYYGL